MNSPQEYTDLRRPLSDEEKLVLEYVKQTPKKTAEDIVGYFVFCAGNEVVREDYNLALEYLIRANYCTRDLVTFAITFHSED